MTEDSTEPPPGEPPLRMRYAAVSDVGRHRKENQDSGYASGHLLVVADGVGGAAYGDVASATAVHLLRRLDRMPTDDVLPALAGAVHRIHDRLAEMVEQDGELEGTSTTLTAALFDGQRLGFAHVGDSRAYLLRDGQIRQLTKDHTFVQTLIDEGRITEDAARIHPHRNVILRAVDGMHDTEPDLFHVDLQPGDRVLLCSDGCSGVIEDDDLAALLGSSGIDAAARALVEAALEGGSTDNVTVVVAEPVDSADSSDTEGSPGAGPLVVGAAASQPRRGGGLARALFRGRQHDTGELEPVPAADVDEEELRYAPRAPKRRGRIRRTLLILLPLLLIAAGLAGAYTWSQNQYYVAADGPQVAIFRGVQADVPLVQLTEPYEVDETQVDDLPRFERGEVEAGIPADDLSHARRILDDLAEKAEQCRRQAAEAQRQQEQQQEQEQRAQQDRATQQDQRDRDRRDPEPSPSPTSEPSPSPAPDPAGCE